MTYFSISKLVQSYQAPEQKKKKKKICELERKEGRVREKETERGRIKEEKRTLAHIIKYLKMPYRGKDQYSVGVPKTRDRTSDRESRENKLYPELGLKVRAELQSSSCWKGMPPNAQQAKRAVQAEGMSGNWN